MHGHVDARRVAPLCLSETKTCLSMRFPPIHAWHFYLNSFLSAYLQVLICSQTKLDKTSKPLLCYQHYLPSDNSAYMCCSSLNRMAKASGSILASLRLSVVLPWPPAHPNHAPSTRVHPKTSAEVNRAGGSWTWSWTSKREGRPPPSVCWKSRSMARAGAHSSRIAASFGLLEHLNCFTTNLITKDWGSGS